MQQNNYFEYNIKVIKSSELMTLNINIIIILITHNLRNLRLRIDNKKYQAKQNKTTVESVIMRQVKWQDTDVYLCK